MFIIITPGAEFASFFILLRLLRHFSIKQSKVASLFKPQLNKCVT